MKVIIELDESVKIENVENSDTLINIYVERIAATVNIEELKAALRKMTTK